MNYSFIGIGVILYAVIVILAVLILISCVKIVHQAQAVVVERLGAYHVEHRSSF